MKPNVLSKMFTSSKDSSSKYKTGSVFLGVENLYLAAMYLRYSDFQTEK